MDDFLPISPVLPDRKRGQAIHDATKLYQANLLLDCTTKFPEVQKLGSYFIRGCVNWEDRARYREACKKVICFKDVDKEEFERIKEYVKKHSSISDFP